MAKKATASKRTKEEIYTLAIKKAGGAFKFWRKIAEANGAGDFKLYRGDDGNFWEKAVSGKGIVGFWIGGKKAWQGSDNPMGKGIIGGKLLIARDAKGTSVNIDLLK